MARYDRGAAAGFYDEYGGREWPRFETGVSSPAGVIERGELDAEEHVVVFARKA
jgi:hypothetical protein